MPLSMCRRLGEIEIIPTHMTLQLADRSIARPYGVIEDVLVKVKHLIFPADFVVIDIEEDTDIPLILGRPFMSTASCVVDMGKKMLQMGIEDHKISFDLFHEDKEPLDRNVYFKVHVMEERRPEKKVLEVEHYWIMDNRMMHQANDVKEALTGRQPDFSFPSLSSFLFLACS